MTAVVLLEVALLPVVHARWRAVQYRLQWSSSGAGVRFNVRNAA